MVTAIIQARVGSTRLYNKIFADICGRPLIWHVVNRLTFSKRIEKIVLATTVNPLDDALEHWAKEEGIACFRGSESDVLDRFFQAAKQFKSSTVVRITADDPFKDPEVIDAVLEALQTRQVDFAYNNCPPSFPEGIDTEVFSFAALEKAAMESRDAFEREHVTQYFFRNQNLFSHFNVAYGRNISHLRWTIDTESDLEMTRRVYQLLYREGKIFLMQDILDLLEKHPDLSEINRDVKRSHMYVNT